MQFKTNKAVVLNLFSIVAIGKPKLHVHKASHCGSKQQQSSPNEITPVVTISKYNQLFTRFTSIVRGHSRISFYRDHSIIACLRHTYMVLFFMHIPFMVNNTF